MQLTVWMNFYHINETFQMDEARLVNKIHQTYIIGDLAEIQLHGWGHFSYMNVILNVARFHPYG
jgi:hypothetical protein